MTGKEKCRVLKVIRKTIAEENGIDFNFEQCKHIGECTGFCEKCDYETRYLEKELHKKILAGQSIQLSKIAYPSLLDELGAATVLDDVDDNYICCGDIF